MLSAPYTIYVAGDGILSFVEFNVAFNYISVGNEFHVPYSLIAPFFVAQNIDPQPTFLKSAVYFLEDPGKSITFQWTNAAEHVNSVTQSTSAVATSTYQAVLLATGEIYFLYKTARCLSPANQAILQIPAVQVGVKGPPFVIPGGSTPTPSTMLYGSCNLFHYAFPKSNSIVYLKPKACTSVPIPEPICQTTPSPSGD